MDLEELARQWLDKPGKVEVHIDGVPTAPIRQLTAVIYTATSPSVLHPQKPYGFPDPKIRVLDGMAGYTVTTEIYDFPDGRIVHSETTVEYIEDSRLYIVKPEVAFQVYDAKTMLRDMEADQEYIGRIESNVDVDLDLGPVIPPLKYDNIFILRP